VGERSHLAGKEVNLSLHVLDVCNVLKWEDLSDVVLCGHSYSGMVITGVADAMPKRIRSLVYLDAFVPEDGKAVWDYFLPERREMALQATLAAGGRLPPTPAERFNVNAADRAWVDQQCVPMAIACFLERICLTGAHAKVKKRVYIWAQDWNPSPFGAFYEKLKMDKAWSVHATRTGHDVMLDDPEGLARLLLVAA